MTVADFVAAIAQTRLEKHGEIVKHLKSNHGLTHGNANLIAHKVRETLAGGPVSDAELLNAQYSGRKSSLRPIYERLAEFALALGPDVEQVIQKTGVSFRRSRQFALVQAPSSTRVQLGLNLNETPVDARISEAKGMCSHRIDLTDLDEIDDTITGWVASAYEQAG